MPGGDDFVDWCNKTLTTQNKNALFNDIPAIGHILVRPSNSLSVRSLEELSWQEIARRFQEEGLHPKLLEFLSTNDETKQSFLRFPCQESTNVFSSFLQNFNTTMRMLVV